MEDRISIMKEIIQHIKETGNFSYYDLEDYAAANKPTWYDELRHSKKTRAFIAEYLRSARKAANLEYR